MVRTWPGLIVTAALLAAMIPATTVAADPAARHSSGASDRLAAEKLAKPVTMDKESTARLSAKLAAIAGKSGAQRVIVRLSAPPSVQQVNAGAAAQKDAYAVARAQQNRVIALAKGIDPGTKVLGRTGKASNVVMLKADAKTLARLAKSRDVVAIVPVKDYSLDLSETVPYVGAKIVQAKGFSGQGVDVAILDTGIDYTHAALGGAGTGAAFVAAYGVSPSDPANTMGGSVFPTARVKGGYDFVGEGWPGTTLNPVDEAPDPDPIDSPAAGVKVLGVDYGTQGGHGTHVADIIGGTLGMAPKANLYAVKVCSSVATSCSGVALMNAMDWAMDPNGDGYLKDHVDVINMSLGSDYGTPYDDDLSLAVQRATHYAGILTVAAAGNGGNKPYISGTPAGAASALSVAQTQVPSAKKFPLVISAPAAIAGTYKNVETVEWAPLGTTGISGDVVYVGGNGCPGGATEPAPGSLTGKVALVDRGACAVSLKTDAAAKAGAKGVLIGLVAGGDAVSFSYGGGDTFVPTMVIQQTLSQAIKDQLVVPATVTVSASSATSVPLVHGVVGSSSRGPSAANQIKPEIGAPGASVSAVSGSGTGTQAFGGTSGATPMVTGAAALLRGAFPGRSPLEIKAVLMNTAETDVYTDPALYPGVRAPITRIGGGELRVNRALKSPIAVWNPGSESAAISFGFVDGTRTLSLTRNLRIRNYSDHTKTYNIRASFRYGNDKANGAVKISVPSSVTLKPHQTKTIAVTATVTSSKLRNWVMNGGGAALDPATLDLMEYDGYIKFDRANFTGDNADPVHVAWQVLPRKSGDVRTPDGTSITIPSSVDLQNVGAGTAAVDAYSLVGTSGDIPGSRPGMNAPVIDLKAVGVQTFPVGPDMCGPTDSFVYGIAVNRWERQTSSIVPGEIDVDIDVNHDGTPDFDVFAAPPSLSNGLLLTYVYNYKTKAAPEAWFAADSATNDSNTVLWFCGDQLGLDATAFGTPWTMDVYAFDSYYRDFALTDAITGIEVSPLRERLGPADFSTSIDIAPHTTSTLDVADWTTDYAGEPMPDGNPSDMGLLLITNANRGTYFGGAPKGNEAIQLLLPTP